MEMGRLDAVLTHEHEVPQGRQLAVGGGLVAEVEGSGCLREDLDDDNGAGDGALLPSSAAHVRIGRKDMQWAKDHREVAPERLAGPGTEARPK